MTSRSALPAAVDLGQGVVFDPPLYLAPMDGVTDRTFRALVLEQNGQEAVGAACTEFQRVSQVPLKLEGLRKELGAPIAEIPVGIQLMGNQPEPVAETSVRAAEAGAAFVDLNFGCPAPRVFQHCAGSALLDDPERLEALVRATVAASPVPVTAKIRGGVNHADGLEDIAKRIEQAGAVMLTVHGRLRVDKYTDPPDWSYLVRTKAAVSIPVFGNGNAQSPESIDRMFAETGVDGVMIGRGAMQDPLLFRRWWATRVGEDAPAWTEERVFAWLDAYHRSMLDGGTLPRHALGRLKQAVKGFRSGGHLTPDSVGQALRSRTAEDLVQELVFCS